MKFACFLLLAASLPAHADLYRWVDPETGSVKFSNVAPVESELARRPLRVEVIPYGPPAAAAAPASAPTPAPAAAPASAALKPPPPPAPEGPLASLEERWRALLKTFSALPTRADFERAGSGMQAQVDAYKAVSAELDRLDPAGAARRRAEDTSVLGRLLK